MNKMGLTESLIYMLLPQQTRSDLFHYILDNSFEWHDIPIDNKFKFTVSVTMDDPHLWFWNSGYLNECYSTDGDDAKVHFYDYRLNLYLFVTAWENNIPLFSMPYGAYISRKYSSNYTTKTVDGIQKKYWFGGIEYKYKPNTLQFSNNNFNYSFNTAQGRFGHKLIIPDINFVLHQKWFHDNNTSPEVPHIVMYDEQDVSYTARTSTQTIYTVPSFEGTFSDISYIDVIDKYQEEIVKAIYEANGYVFRGHDDYWVEPEV